MSSSEIDSDKINKALAKSAVIKTMAEIKALKQEDVIDYIKKLHALLNKRDKKLKKYKEKINKLRNQLGQPKSYEEKSTATDATPNDEAKLTATQTGENHASAVCDFVNEIRQAAEQAQNLNGFVYEPTSGLYYDQKTGYYYNAEYGLYYDGNTGSYYNYNQEKNVFEFHSQVQASEHQKKSTSNENGIHGDREDVDDVDEDVEFDEWGVITDKEKLRKIREEKEKTQKSRDRYRRRKKRRDNTKHSHKSKKHKRSVHDTDSDGSVNSDSKANPAVKTKKKSDDIEDGELSSSSSESGSSSDGNASYTDTYSSSDCQDKSNIGIFSKGSRFQDIAKKYPPSLRIIVQETNVDAIKVGSLNLITFKGGSLGREGNHDVIIPDVNVSKTHLRFHYDRKHCIYKCIDVGSRNGTVLNGVRMSVTKAASGAHDLVHGSILQIGQTKLLCHVHEGNTTCGLCEPGLLIEATREPTTSAAPAVVLSHKEQLKMLQKKYGLEHEKFVDNKQNAGNYNDRAATRRVQVGSTTDAEKTETASLHTEISSENKGFKMLSKLGWNRGETLGKLSDSNALLEPINVTSNEGKKGLGCDTPHSVGVSLSNADKRKIESWKKTQQRYQKADIFEDSDEDA